MTQIAAYITCALAVLCLVGIKGPSGPLAFTFLIISTVLLWAYEPPQEKRTK